MIDAQLLRQHNNTATEFFEAGQRGENKRIVELLEAHQPTNKSVSGFLMTCTCGEAVDDTWKHLLEVVKGEDK
jgi:hypothetical protein